MIKVRLISFFFWIIVFFISCKPSIVDSKDETIINNQFEGLKEILEAYASDVKINGGVGLVYHKGKIVFHKGFGVSNMEANKPSENSDIFRIASMTKPITSIAAMMLFDEGKFKLDDPVSKFLPEFENMEILESINKSDSTFNSRPAMETMTVQQLFTFTSGLYYGYDVDTLSLIFAKNEISEGFEERNISLEENTKRIASMPLLHEPGDRYHYGLEMDVLGRLVEVWSGKTLDVFLKERIFSPLDMNDTYFYLPESKFDRLVPVYMNSDEGIKATNYPLINYPIAGAKTYLSGGADLSTTAYDYFLFCKMILDKGRVNEKQIIKSETIDLISSTHLETGDNDMGLGFGLLSNKTNTDLARSIGSITWGGFFSTIFWIDPEEDVIAILMLQMYPFDHWDIQKDFEDTIYSLISRQNETD